MKFDIQKGTERAIWFLPIFLAIVVALGHESFVAQIPSYSTFLGAALFVCYMSCFLYVIFTLLLLAVYIAAKFFWRGFLPQQTAKEALIKNKPPIVLGLCISISVLALSLLAIWFLPNHLVVKINASQVGASDKSARPKDFKEALSGSSLSDSEILKLQNKLEADKVAGAPRKEKEQLERAQRIEIVGFEIKRLEADNIYSSDGIAKLTIKNNNDFSIKSVRAGFYFFSPAKDYLEREYIKDIPIMDEELKPAALSPGASGVYSCRIKYSSLPSEADLNNTKVKILEAEAT